MLQMDAVMTIRHLVLVKGESRRAVAARLGLSRNTVRRYLEGAPIGERRSVPRERRKFDAVRARMDALLAEAPKWTQGKQRLTATQLWRMLRAEGHLVGASLVKAYVRELKRRQAEVFVPLTYRPGDLGEVDFFEVYVDIEGKRRKAWMFLLRGMASGRDFAWVYPRQDQTCFLDGHARAFAHLGAVYQRLVYDNLRPAVVRVLVGSERQLTTRFAALANHYLYEPCFARPATGHDKGGVEARGKGVRWAHLVPIPSGRSLEEVSRALLARLDAEAPTKKDAEGRSVSERFTEELPQMLPLAARPFASAEMVPVRPSRRALVALRGGTYSVWSDWAQLDLTAYLGVDEVEIVGPTGRVRHPRKSFGGRSIDYRHYLRELSRKPQALRQVAHELLPRMDERFTRAWHQLVDLHGPKQAARVMAQVLRAVVTDGEAVVALRVEDALRTGESLQLATRSAPTATSELPVEAVPHSLREVRVAAASAADFDALLGGAS